MEHRRERVGSPEGDGLLSRRWMSGPTRIAVVAVAFLPAIGCELNWTNRSLDVSVVRGARLGFQDHYERHRLPGPSEPEESAEPSLGDYILAELIAIFPGLIIPGLGHYYAGDHETARQLRSVGEIGYLFTALGAGMFTGGYFLDDYDEDGNLRGYTYTLYGTGALFGAIGLGYLLTGWVYDMVDTPRALESGGKPPPKTPFVKDLDFFD